MSRSSAAKLQQALLLSCISANHVVSANFIASGVGAQEGVSGHQQVWVARLDGSPLGAKGVQEVGCSRYAWMAVHGAGLRRIGWSS